MASIIDNRNKTMLDSLKNSLKQAERVSILIFGKSLRMFCKSLYSGVPYSVEATANLKFI